MEYDEEDTETHAAIHTREAYEKLSIVYEKVREGCHYDISCVRRYHFDFDFSSQYTYNCTIHPELRRATTNTCKQNNCANSHELCPPKKSIHVFEVGLETRGERQFTRLSPFPRRAVLVVHHSCTESKATTRNLVAAPEEPRSLKTPGKPE